MTELQENRMKNSYRIWLGVLLFAFTQVMAGTTGKIAGNVIDKSTNEPLIGVNVFLDGTVIGASTDVNGEFVILNIPPGKYTIMVQYLGYHEIKREGVAISIDHTTRLSFEMQSETLELDEAIVVQGRANLVQKDMTSSQSMVTSEQIDALPVVELSDILQLQPGVTRDAGGGFHIRGGRSSEISYWINGVSVSDAYDNSQAIDVDNNSIQELQVISGTFNAEYGNAMSGIINTVTKEGGRKYTADIQVFSGDHLSNFDTYFYNISDFKPTQDYSTRASLSGPIGKNFSFYATSRYNYSDGYLYGTRKFSVAGDTLVKQNADGSFQDGKVVPMNWSKNWTGQAKLTFLPVPEFKINFEGLFSRRNYQDYDHALKFAPDGNVNKFSDSFDGWISVNHTLSPTTFYDLNLAYLDKQFREHLYDSPTDSRYQDPIGRDVAGQIQPWRRDQVSFATGGTNNHRFFRETTTISFKGNITSQVSRNHLLKAGFEARTHKITFDDYGLQDGAPTDKNLFLPTVPDKNSSARTYYDRKPVDYSTYVQDKIEYNDVIINLGIRMDYFDARADIPAIPDDPDVNNPIDEAYVGLSYAQRKAHYLKKASAKWQVSPRFGIAYPITEKGVIHFSYGHFLQIPSFEFLYNRGDYRIPANATNAGIYGNADLKAQKTIMYELGLQQELMSDFKIDVTGFYRDVRDWITSSASISMLNQSSYVKYINKDYANVKGLTVTLQKRYSDSYSFDLSYTYQVAEGSNSSPQEEYAALNADVEPSITILPLDWDQRHLFNSSFYYGRETWGASMIARLGSGLPYTPQITSFNSFRGISSGLQKNSRRRPYQFTIDLRLHKNFDISGQKFIAFLRVFNLLDNRIAVNVFGDTGKANYTNSYAGQQSSGPNTVEEYVRFPWQYGEPRRVQFGLEWSLN